MNAVKVIGVLVLLLGILVSLATAMVGNRVVDVIADQAAQPESATDLIMRSRQTAVSAPPDTTHPTLAGAGLFAITLLMMGGVVFVMQGGTDLLKQWRLTQKRPKKQSQPAYPIPYATWIETPKIPPAPEVHHENAFDDVD